MASPFDDSPVDEKPKRKRRPWWRWNLITLMGVLFVLAWVRELASLPIGGTWLLAFTVIAVWATLPALFVPTWLTALDTSQHSAARDSRISGGWLFVAFKIAACIGMAVAFVVMAVALWGTTWQLFTGYGFRSWERLLWSLLIAFAYPLAIFGFSAIVYSLAEIAQQLRRRPKDE